MIERKDREEIQRVLPERKERGYSTKTHSLAHQKRTKKDSPKLHSRRTMKNVGCIVPNHYRGIASFYIVNRNRYTPYSNQPI